MTTCENCEGLGSWEVVHGYDSEWGYEVAKWVACPACGGSGWVHGEPQQLTMEEVCDVD